MSESPETRFSLLARIRDVRDEEAWAEFVDLYAPVIYSLARRQGLQDADAGDVTQDVLRRVLGAIQHFAYDPQRGSFRGWLFTVARNRLRKFFHERHRHTPGSGDEDVAQLLEEQPAPAEEVAWWEREYEQHLFEWAAARVRGRFRAPTWEAFWRTAVQGQEAREVSASLGMSVGAVYIAKNRVLARIRREIQRVENEGTP